MAKRRIPKSRAKSIAKGRIDRLFALTEREERLGNRGRSKRYVELAQRIGMRYEVSLSKWKRRFCPECKTYYRFPVNASVRLKRGKLIIRCNECGCISRYPYK